MTIMDPGEPIMLYVGIDQHRKQLTVSVRDESGNVILRSQVSTEWKKVRAFFDEEEKVSGTVVLLFRPPARAKR